MSKTLDNFLLALGFSLACQLGCSPSHETVKPSAFLPSPYQVRKSEDALHQLRSYLHQLCDDSVVTPKLLYCKDSSDFIYRFSEIQAVSVYRPGFNHPWSVRVCLKGATVWHPLFALATKQEALKIALPLAVLVENYK